MSQDPDTPPCAQMELIPLLAVEALPPDERLEVEAHVESCDQCRQELAALRRVTESFVAWPTDVLRPSPTLWERVAKRIYTEGDVAPAPVPAAKGLESKWELKAPGIWCKLVTTDVARSRVGMLVRLEPGVAYPAHMHSEFEELHLLEGELWIEDRKLYPGDFNRAEPGTTDRRVWTQTGCTCFLATSYSDALL